MNRTYIAIDLKSFYASVECSHKDYLLSPNGSFTRKLPFLHSLISLFKEKPSPSRRKL